MSQHLYKSQQKKLAKRIIESLPTDIILPTITEWAELNRYYSPGVSSFYGMHKATTAPHMVEILENLHPDSPITWTSVMKSVQSTATTTAECAIGFYIRYKLANMGYYTATQELAKIRGSANIDTMIDNSGLAEYVKPHSNRNNRKKADSALYKEFSGGIKLQLNSYNSIGGMKSNTIQFMTLDEIDEMPLELKGQGSTLETLKGRMKAVRHPKCLVISTPSNMETSMIYQLFMEGDQRYRYLPCPLCGEMQVLEFKTGDIKHGLTFSTEKDKETGQKNLIPETVRYICKHCGKEFHESKKQWMQEHGEWRPHAKSKDPLKRSYHVSGLLSPEMFLSWETICQDFVDTRFGKDITKLKGFVINDQGLPWSRVEKHESWEYIRDKAEEYSLGELHPSSLILYGGVDVQGDRLELCVISIGKGMESAIVDYKIFYGNPASLSDPCYMALDTFVRTKTYEFHGRKLPIRYTGMDTGYDPKKKRIKDWDSKSNTIYQFVGPRQDKFRAIKGFPDIQSNFDLIQEARVTAGLLTKFYKINTPMMKEMVYKDVTIFEGPRAIHFPKYRVDEAGSKRYIGDEFYKQFMSERYQETSPGVMGWKKIRSRNEVLDTYLYGKAMAFQDNLQVWTDAIWDKYKAGLLGNK